MVKSSQWLINKTPQAEVQLSGPNATFKLSETEISSPSNDGELLVKARYFSNDPAQRRWIAPAPVFLAAAMIAAPGVAHAAERFVATGVHRLHPHAFLLACPTT